MDDKINLNWVGQTPEFEQKKFRNTKEIPYLEELLNCYASRFPNGFDIDVPNSMLKRVKDTLTKNFNVVFTQVGGFEDNTTLAIYRNKEDMQRRERNR